MTLALIITGALSLIGLSVYYLLVFAPKLKQYKATLFSFYPFKLVRDERLASEVAKVADDYARLAETSFDVENKIFGLEFPIPEEPDRTKSGEDIINKSTSVLNKDSLAFVGIEQIVLMAFPPDQLVNCLLYATETIASHASQAGFESFLSLKASLLEGSVNIHNPEILLECLKQFSATVMESIQHPVALKGLFDAIEHHHTFNIFYSFVNWHTVSNGLDPAFNVHQHLNEIGHSWLDHGSHASHAIINHIDVTMSPDPSGHFPVVTLFISGIREGKLLYNKKTSFDVSLKNLGLDIAGTWGGAAGGGKVGAAIGTLILPGVGTFIGGIIGGLGGAIGGRALTNSIKYIDLKKSIDIYQNIYGTMLGKTHNVAIKCVEEVRFSATSAKEDFLKKIGNAPGHAANKPEIIFVANNIAQYRREELKKLRITVAPFRISNFSKLRKFKRILIEIDAKIKYLEMSIPSQVQIENDPVGSLKRLADQSFLESEIYHTMAEEAVKDLNKKNVEVSSSLVFWAYNSGNLYKNAIYGILKDFKIQSQVFYNACNEWKIILDSKEKAVNIEKAKLGMN